MWEIKTFKSQQEMNNFIKQHKNKIMYNEIFVNNAYAIEYKKLKRIY